MIIGTYTSNISPARRVAVPKKFRQEMPGNFVVTRWYENCLVLVSAASWQDLMKKVSTPSLLATGPVRDTDRFIMGSAYEVEVDRQGRVVLPQQLTDYAGLKDEVLFIGLGDRVEIWDRKEWKKREEYVASHASELLETIAHGEKNS